MRSVQKLESLMRRVAKDRHDMPGAPDIALTIDLLLEVSKLMVQFNRDIDEAISQAQRATRTARMYGGMR